MTAQKFRVAICGGGIGGLTCAIALQQYPDIQVDVYEAAAKFAEVGAGVGIWPRPWKLLQALGLANDLLQTTDLKPTSESVPIINWRKSDQEQGIPFYTLRGEGILLTFSRLDFQNVLLRRSTSNKHCSKRLKSWRQGSTVVELFFEDGTTATCDVLIGADGIKSAVRRSMLTQLAQRAETTGRTKDAEEFAASIEPVWCGTIAYRTVLPADKLRSLAPNHPALTAPQQYLGKNAHVIAYPISLGRLVNLAVFICRHDMEGAPYKGPWVSNVDRGEISAAFAAWEPELRILIDCADKAMKWVIHTVRPLRSFVLGSVALIGDAAHAEQPTQGAGAGQAIEDAYLLATLLGHPKTTAASLPRALSIYDAVRRPFSADVAERSRCNAHCFSFCHPLVNDLGRCRDDAEMRRRLAQLAEAIRTNWKWVWSTTLDESVAQALRMLESPLQ